MVRSLFGKWLGYAAIAVVVVAIWRANGSDVQEVVQNGWGAVDTAANGVVNVWNSAVGGGEAPAEAPAS